MASDSDVLNVTLDDLQQHIVKYGLDVFPPLDVRNEVTRTHDLFQALQEGWPDLYQELNFRPQSGEFKVLTSLESKAGSIKHPTLVFTQRGPMFAFACRLPDPLGVYHREGDLDEVVLSSLAVIRKTFPGIDVLRIGLVRELVFTTGKTISVPYLADRFGVFSGTAPKGGSVRLTFQDDRCNVRITIGTIEIRRQAHVAMSGQVLTDELAYGLQVVFDVNNIEMRPQETADIETTLQRARSLWPKELLDFVNWRRANDEST